MAARFRAVLAIRQAHGFAFGKSDLFFCVALTCAGPAAPCTQGEHCTLRTPLPALLGRLGRTRVPREQAGGWPGRPGATGGRDRGRCVDAARGVRGHPLHTQPAPAAAHTGVLPRVRPLSSQLRQLSGIARLAVQLRSAYTPHKPSAVSVGAGMRGALTAA